MLGYLLSWHSPLFPVHLWHMLYDGTRLCPCERSRRWQDALSACLAGEELPWGDGGGEA